MKHNQDSARLAKMRIAVRFLVSRNGLERGHQTRLAEHFNVSRQRVSQVVAEERAEHLGMPRPRRRLPTSQTEAAQMRHFAP